MNEPVKVGLKTLYRVLIELGLTHAKASSITYKHHIYKGEDVLFTGTAHEVWAWLRETGRIESE